MQFTMTRPEPSLAKLPQELMDDITQYAEHSDLSRLSMTCRTVRAAVYPKLFKNIRMVLRDENEEQSQYTTRQHAVSSKTCSLAQVLLEKPDLAKLVQSINIDFQAKKSCGAREKWVKTAMPKRTRHMTLFESATENANPWRRNMWARIIEKSGLDGVALLFISTCPNLESLDLGLDILGENDYSEEDKDDANEEINESDGEYNTPDIDDDDVDDIEPLDEEEQQSNSTTRFSGLTSLSSKCARALRRSRKAQSWVDLTKSDVFGLAYSLAALKTLQLHATALPPTQLQECLRRTISLQTLTYGYHIHVENKGLNCEELQSALDSVKRTIKQLSITCQFFSENEKTNLRKYKGSFVSSHCTFKDFPLLHYLHVSPEVLLGWDRDRQPKPDVVLPPNLETLSWRADYAEYADSNWSGASIEWWLDSFIRSGGYRTRTPHWRLFTIWNVWAHNCIWIDDEEEAYLRMLCDSNKDQIIELDVRYS